MNTVSTAFTGMGIAVQQLAVVGLNPLNSWIVDHRNNLPQYDEIVCFYSFNYFDYSHNHLDTMEMEKY